MSIYIYIEMTNYDLYKTILLLLLLLLYIGHGSNSDDNFTQSKIWLMFSVLEY